MMSTRAQTSSTPQPSQSSGRARPTQLPAARYPLQGEPDLLKVYFLPHKDHILPSSVVHKQKQQHGFFLHPILVVEVDSTRQHAYFYALTRMPPKAIGEMGMCFRMGKSRNDVGDTVLRLAIGSHAMEFETWVNLDQRFSIEWQYLDYWKIEVNVDHSEFRKLNNKVNELEAEQNRFIYKPLWRDLSVVIPGTVVMLMNPTRRSNTLGSPVLVLENEHHRLRILRIKAVHDNRNLDRNGTGKNKDAAHLCLRIGRFPEQGHNGTPVLYLEHGSPDMREPSYLEVCNTPRWAPLQRFKTWCYPYIRIQPNSMEVLWRYMQFLDSPNAEASTPSQHVANQHEHNEARPGLHANTPPLHAGFPFPQQFHQHLLPHMITPNRPRHITNPPPLDATSQHQQHQFHEPPPPNSLAFHTQLPVSWPHGCHPAASPLSGWGYPHPSLGMPSPVDMLSTPTASPQPTPNFYFASPSMSPTPPVLGTPMNTPPFRTAFLTPTPQINSGYGMTQATGTEYTTATGSYARSSRSRPGNVLPTYGSFHEQDRARYF